MDEKIFTDICKKLVVQYTKQKLHKDISEDNVYTVWICKTLQNNKALMATSLRDSMYYELTYNGDKKELYLDAYKKKDNVVVGVEVE